jgi:hypothetical protein
MLRLTDIKLPLDHAPEALREAVVRMLGVAATAVGAIHVFRRGQDARKKNAISFLYTVDVEVSDEERVLKRAKKGNHVALSPDTSYHFIARANGAATQRPIVVGTGPCGIFTALVLAQMGFRPIVLERGKPVRERTKDTFAFWRKGILNPESNVQFGEGGAGTFSDGKLYSQIRDPKHYSRKVLSEFVKAGAPPEILYVSKPHIGTLKLVRIVEELRTRIIALGGEVRFETKVVDLLRESAPNGAGRVRGVVVESGGVREELHSDHVVLALGHSARDTFRMIHHRGVYVEAKPFSIGFRIEHPQSGIDRARFGVHAGNPLLGAADYKLVHHAKNGRAVYSFCMCPGGTVVAATSELGRVVTNGMSQYSRKERNANSAIVVGITPEDFPKNDSGPLAGIDLQQEIEARAFVLGGSTYEAPAQLVGDFLAGRSSGRLGEVIPSYKPGIALTDLATALPSYAIEAMREALPVFDKQIEGFARPDALLTGVETRTSSPIRILRDEACQSVNTVGLFPAGEGAGYAGGILSAAVDGIRVAEAVAASYVAAGEARALAGGEAFSDPASCRAEANGRSDLPGQTV